MINTESWFIFLRYLGHCKSLMDRFRQSAPDYSDWTTVGELVFDLVYDMDGNWRS